MFVPNHEKACEKLMILIHVEDKRVTEAYTTVTFSINCHKFHKREKTKSKFCFKTHMI